jgi:hypothetical protein
MDPSEAALKRQKLWQARQETGMKMQQLHQHEQAIQGKRIREQKTKMMDLIPAWRDDNVRKADQDALRGHLKANYGFSDNELNRIEDARTMAVLQDYIVTKRELDELKSKADAATKRVRQAPRVLRDKGGRFMAQQGDDELKTIEALSAKAKRTGNKYDAQAAAAAILKKAQRGIPRSSNGRQSRRRD